MNKTGRLFGTLMAASVATTATIAFAGNGEHVFKFDDVAWQETGLDGAEMAVLWGREEDGNAIWAFRIQPGVGIPPHMHTNDYWGIAVQGRWVHIDKDGHEVATAQESFTRIRGGEMHADRCAGPEVCINVIDFAGARDITFPE